ncbi:GL22987 [Drosophila persimilis]|uniref:GL22987 n=1 Tax=Drosophila persimilis TaxID=7234 RepID=B4G4L4_DROPE|nr:GL22987 [Drosophila persimilis]
MGDTQSRRQAYQVEREEQRASRSRSPELQLLASPLVSTAGSMGPTVSPVVSPGYTEAESDLELVETEGTTNTPTSLTAEGPAAAPKVEVATDGEADDGARATAEAKKDEHSPEPWERGPWRWPEPGQGERPKLGRQASCPGERAEARRPELQRQASWPQTRSADNSRWRSVKREEWPAVVTRSLARIKPTARRVNRLVNDGGVRYRLLVSTDRQEVFRARY